MQLLGTVFICKIQIFKQDLCRCCWKILPLHSMLCLLWGPISVCFDSCRPLSVTQLSCHALCLSVSVLAGDVGWMGSSYFCVCSAFINIPLLGDKLMSPGSLIATSQLLWVSSDTFCATSQWVLYITCCELHSSHTVHTHMHTGAYFKERRCVAFILSFIDPMHGEQTWRDSPHIKNVWDPKKQTKQKNIKIM